jgi:hypothetical protein
MCQVLGHTDKQTLAQIDSKLYALFISNNERQENILNFTSNIVQYITNTPESSKSEGVF